MKPLIYYQTKIGTFYICQSSDRRFHPVFNDESLGSYDSPEDAIDDLVGGHTYSVLHPKNNRTIDTAELDIPDDIFEWERAS